MEALVLPRADVMEWPSALVRERRNGKASDGSLGVRPLLRAERVSHGGAFTVSGVETSSCK